MVNSLTAFNPAFWTREMQPVFFKKNPVLAYANTELRDYLEMGTTVHKPYRSSLVAQTYTKGTDISTFNDLTGTDDSLAVDTCKVVPFYVDDIDRIQNKWDVAAQYAQDAQRVLNNLLEQKVLSNYSSANNYISAQDLGGSGTGSVAITQANIYNMFAVAQRVLEHADVDENSQIAVIGPRLLEILRLSIAGRETGFGDTVGDNGVVGNRFGFQIVKSNNVPFTAVITISNTPVDAGTVTIDGVVFTWETHGTNCATAGEVDLGTDATTAGDNLVLAINGTTAGTTATYCDVSAANRWKLNKHGLTATNSSGTVTITGYGDIAITENSTNVAVTSVTQYPLFMAGKPLDLIVQKSPNVEFRMAEKRLGRYVYPWTLYGSGVWTNMKNSFLYASTDVSAWV